MAENDTKTPPKSGSERSESSGRFVLRIDPGLHAALREAAAAAGMSLNAYCATRLAMPLGDPAIYREGAAVVRRAATLLGARMVAVAVFGSWARGEAAARSDVDVLVVIDKATALNRALYRRWDADPACWGRRPVEPHFVHLPPADERVSGLWAEVAVDGIVLFDRDLRLSKHLIAIRRAVAAGRLVRRLVHGQAYWTEAA